MKKNLFLLAIIGLILAGCQDSTEVRSAVGTYSYKASGILQVDTLASTALTEQGALEIVSLKNNDSVLITFNELLGGVYSTRGSIQGNEITLQPFTRNFVHVKVINPVTIVVTGKGNIYDNNIIMELHYSSLDQDSIMLTANDVQLIAKKNKE